MWLCPQQGIMGSRLCRVSCVGLTWCCIALQVGSFKATCVFQRLSLACAACPLLVSGARRRGVTI